MKRKHVRCITINTDASFSKEKGVGGYAFYIVCDTFKIYKSGIFKKNPESSIQAEMMCMANALRTVTLQSELPSTALIVINSDCLFSFRKITLKSKDPIGRRVAHLLREVRLKTSFKEGIMPKFEFRHVKAHSGSTERRSLANEWCDKEAKKMMRHALYLLTQPPTA